jgi:Tol biopolymer transport system component
MKKLVLILTLLSSIYLSGCTNSNHIAFIADKNNILAVTQNGEVSTVFHENSIYVYNMAWSPNGSKFAILFMPNPAEAYVRFNQCYGIWIRDSHCQMLAWLHSTGGSCPLDDYLYDNVELIWSPDSNNLIVYWPTDEFEGTGIFDVINLDSLTKVSLAIPFEYEELTAEKSINKEVPSLNSLNECSLVFWGNHPKWSSDSKQIVFSTVDQNQNTIWLMDADGGNKKKVANGTVPTFAP